MSGVFSGNVFGPRGGSIGSRGALGGLFDFWDTDEDAAKAALPAASTGSSNTTVVTGTASTAAKHSDGALPKFGACEKPYIDDPKNPSSFCILDPKGNYTCPANQIYDPVVQKCVPYKPDLIEGGKAQTGVICPYGTKAVGAACVSLVTPGAGTPSTQKPPAGSFPDPNDLTNGLTGSSGIPTWAIALGLVGAAGLVTAAVVAKAKQNSSGSRRGRR